MHTRSARRRRQLGAVVAGLCLAAGSVGTAALADSSGTSVSVDASVMVQAGMNPVSARQAAANLNAAIDSAVQNFARSAASAIPAGHPVRTTAAATQAFANTVDAALTDFAVQTVAGLHAAGTSTNNLVQGTLTALNQVVATIPGAVAVTTGAEFSVAAGNGGAGVSAGLNPTLDTAIRQTISASVRAIRPLLPLTRTTVRDVAAGVRRIEDASVVATGRIVRATVDLAAAVVTVTGTTLQAMRTVADSGVATLNAVVVAVDAALDNLSDVNITAAVDASLQVSAR